MKAGYEIVKKGYEVGIKCLQCGLTSWHSKDVEFKYCGNCNKFHEDEMRDEWARLMTKLNEQS